MIFLCDRQRRESTFDTMRTAADPISRLPHIYETQVRDEHLLATRLFVHVLLLYSADTTPTPDFPLRLRTRALTTTGSGIYTHQASAIASTSLCVVLPLASFP